MGRIRSAIDSIGPTPAAITQHKAWHNHMQAYRGIIDDLVADEGAIYRAGDPRSLKLAGIRTSCTCGDKGLLSNWINAASRRIEEVCQS